MMRDRLRAHVPGAPEGGEGRGDAARAPLKTRDPIALEVTRARRTAAAIAFVAILLPLTARAEAERKLTLDEALALAREHSRDVMAARARLEASRVGIEQAWAGLLPIVAAEGKYTHNYKGVELDLGAQNKPLIGLAEVLRSVGAPSVVEAIDEFERQLNASTPGSVVIQKQDQLDATLSVTVPLVVPSAYANLSAARRGHESAESTYESTLATILLQSARAFYAAAGMDELHRVREHGIEVAKETLDNARARFSAGVVNKVEIGRAELALLRAEQALRETEDTRLEAYRSLATLIVLREPFQVEPPATPPKVDQPPEVLAEKALSLRPEVLALERSIAANEAKVSASLWRWAPSLSAFGNVRAFNYTGFSGDQYAWAVGGALDWTLYDAGIRDAERHLAEAQKSEAEARLSLLKDSILDELANEAHAVETKESALETANRSVQLSTETLRLVRAQHDAGTATQIDLLEAQASLVMAEVAVAQARFDLALANLAYARAAGLFPAKE